MGRGGDNKKRIAGVSGGPDSVFLLHQSLGRKDRLLVAHMDHGWRGEESRKDRIFVEDMARKFGVASKSAMASPLSNDSMSDSRTEGKARDIRRTFLKNIMKESGGDKILLGHTADDQVETVLMRILEGAGISGLKGIPRKTSDGIERPMLDTWREDILKYLHKQKIPYRVDKSNFDTRFERNWIRHVLIPLLEKRYGKSVKKRIFALGERFREIDEYLKTSALRWMKRNLKGAVDGRPGAAREKPIDRKRMAFPRIPFGKHPSALRMKILQILCFERIGVAPNERLLESMDRLIVSGGPSARLDVGKGAVLICRYDQAILDMSGMTAGTSHEKTVSQAGRPVGIRWEEKGNIPQSGLKRLAKGERAAAFDHGEIHLPLSVRPVRAGDRIRPFGLAAGKKVKEILIDRKVPQEERWGRPVVCDAKGTILWIPGVIRSAHAPVTAKTRRTMVLRLEFKDITGNNR